MAHRRIAEPTVGDLGDVQHDRRVGIDLAGTHERTAQERGDRFRHAEHQVRLVVTNTRSHPLEHDLAVLDCDERVGLGVGEVLAEDALTRRALEAQIE